MKVTYYPGCSLEGTAIDYSESILEVCTLLNIQLEEVPDWNCCGATSAHSIDHHASIELAGRNLNLAAQMPNSDMLVPCPLCFNRLKRAAFELQGDNKEQYSINLETSLPKIRDLADFFDAENMLEMVAKHVKRPLEGLKVVCYYGCMANRPPEITETTDFEDPQGLDRIIKNLGGTAISWPYKTDCCEASLLLSKPDIVSLLVGKLYDMAQRVGAQAIVVSCQMCQANLDMYQKKIASELGKRFSLPVYYFSELIGLACNVKDVRKWLSRHITNPFSLLQELGFLE